MMNLPSDDQRERLVLLMEEMAEAQQMIGKCLRHGMASSHPDYGDVPNDWTLAEELGHVVAAIDLVVAARDVDERRVETGRREKHAKVGQFLHFQRPA